jgi:nicotinate phosphoribosyltransferase
MVYKLVAHKNAEDEWVSVAKTSASKATVGGRKSAVRRLDATGTAREEVVMVDSGGPAVPPAATPTPDPTGAAERSLLVPLMEAGVVDERYLGAGGTRLAREQNAAAMRELPIDAFRLGRGDAVIPTVFR